MRLLNRLGELLEDWRFLIRHDGAGKALHLIEHEIALLPYRRMRLALLARSLDEPFPEITTQIPIEIRPFEATDVERVKDIDRPSEGRHCARRLELGQKGIVAVYRGQVVAYAWACTELDANLERVPLQLKEGDVFLTDLYTQSAFRGQGIQTALCVAHFNTYRSLGFKRAICYIEVNNIPSLTVWKKKLNALEIGRIDFTRIGAFYKVNLH